MVYRRRPRHRDEWAIHLPNTPYAAPCAG
jgi:hypothetical protein